MKGQVVRSNRKRRKGRRRLDGSTGPPERLSNIDHRHQKKSPLGAEVIPERRGPVARAPFVYRLSRLA